MAFMGQNRSTTMEFPMQSAGAVAVGQGVVSPTARLAPPRIGAGMVLLIATWIGLIAGSCDVCALIVITKFISGDFYRLGEDFPWIIPSAVSLLVLALAALIACAPGFAGRYR
jgi:hypothetical protein